MKTIILDPGHGMSNRSHRRYDPGATAGGHEEASIVMDWANEIRIILIQKGVKVVRTRINEKDEAPIGDRAKIAKDYNGSVMLSLHCNAFNGTASGTETFYRGEENKVMAQHINDVVVESLGTKDRGVKTEGSSQHSRLAVMSFQPCFLLEIGFIDNPNDLKKMLDPDLRKKACQKIADLLLTV